VSSLDGHFHQLLYRYRVNKDWSEYDAIGAWRPDSRSARVAGEMKTKWQRSMRRMIARDITLAMVLKLALIGALFALFARPAFRPESDAAATAAAVVGTVGNGAISK
jgi:hypothetical protein